MTLLGALANMVLFRGSTPAASDSSDMLAVDSRYLTGIAATMSSFSIAVETTLSEVVRELEAAIQGVTPLMREQTLEFEAQFHGLAPVYNAADHRTPVERAKGLLMEILSDTQRRQYESPPMGGYLRGDKAFGVIGSNGGRYLLLHQSAGDGWSFSTDQVNENWVVYGLDGPYPLTYYCFQSVQDIPWPDKVISWKLWLEGNETEFLDVAVKTREYVDEPEYVAIQRRAKKTTKEILAASSLSLRSLGVQGSSP